MLIRIVACRSHKSHNRCIVKKKNKNILAKIKKYEVAP